MTAELMIGTELAAEMVANAATRAGRLRAETGVQPCLATVLVGDDPASATYVRMKQNRCRKAGIESRSVVLPAATTTAELVAELAKLSNDPSVHGILLQHPVPGQIDERAAFEAIDPGKDVDGVTMHAFAAMAFGEPGFRSCTPGGILRLLQAYDVPLSGAHAVVIGRSPILGKPAGMLLLASDATVTYTHSRTVGLPDIVRTADIVVAAVGKPNFVRGEWLKPGAVVVDAGYNEGNVGDVHFAEATAVARLVTPVPGGVGPMTIALLLEQTVDAAQAQSETAVQPVAGLA
ncbi:bifunctional 5,10-methylene-tetrahydrofolate dehydrogenase/5,10-methylene-tetrahydrofolate cyclohydrolase [Kribbella sandramycini]|uniref:Bifunctional protein FolD n=1 Tax=Kribbella sandramycini TaxID=60450 RepID=A0A7Y4KXS1_9ACTN|nr:tetrahydrofolate dehydrogenase/cyclohydrolase catalytic domain-containing protein [Kribbella sandramycini]MBB6569546.1 methylenetetrahydrofolate dehydrogenase (NADP+)/methenyltetrahydrofolate cyclohydrolase [Kribbella sandramycini]NOL40620.1 bifunctional 5,10-methylene-tetrahydrofolate dehydrogenase/5,10-methylene-tetrahydrofolate cyclohydrolase [Kribbella sandramycini]